MRRYFLTGLSVLAIYGACVAQNEVDALRYSRIGFGGTARYSAMAGAFGALGADMSAIGTNPAGLGFYRKNEFCFTPSFYNQKVNSVYNETSSSDSRFNMRVDNCGIVLAGKTENTLAEGWQTTGIGIIYNRYGSFQTNLTMKGNSYTSMMDSWAKTAGGNGPSTLDGYNEGLAWNTYLLNQIPSDSSHYTDTIPDGDFLAQEKNATVRGGLGEWLIGIGGNYSNKFYVGASLGIQQVKYEEVNVYSETEINDTVSNFEYFKFDQFLTTTGKGFNLKIGFIYRPIDMLRIGFAFHTPTLLKLSDTYGAQMQSVIGGITRESIAQDGSFNYSIRTPMRMLGSVGVVIGKLGLISADYELVDYADARLKSSSYAFSVANANIKSKYKTASTIRVGAEVRVFPIILRAGFAYYGSPYTEGVNNNSSKLYLTGGLGYRVPKDLLFIDLGIITSREKSNYYFYDQSLVNPVNNTSKVVNVVVTCGYRF